MSPTSACSLDVANGVLVLGGGIGGLLAANVAAERGHAVLLVERTPRLGGRFTDYESHGCQISTGALHHVPHGNRGPLGQLMRDLGSPLEVARTDVIASFHTGSQHFMWRRRLGILGLFDPVAASQVARVVLFLRRHRSVPGDPPFSAWLATRTTDVLARTVFERFAEFGLGLELHQTGYAEMRAVFKSVARFGLPAVVAGGCSAVVRQLEELLKSRGGRVLLGHEATRIGLAEDGTVREASVRERATGDEMSIQARWCISNIGPEATGALLPRGSWPVSMSDSGPTADGWKFQVLSEKSLVDHNGIMFCLGTKRISGLVQVSNAIPSAAPPGKHFVNTFQVLKGEDIRDERELGMEDLRYLYGPGTEFEIVHRGGFRRQWPVNRLRQGQDLTDPQPVPGLLMVGDAYKPSGEMMVDGVAGSVSRLRPLLS